MFKDYGRLVSKLKENERVKASKRIVTLLDEENVAYDIASYRDAPPGLRIWSGATIDTINLRDLTPWIDWALAEVSIEFSA